MDNSQLFAKIGILSEDLKSEVSRFVDSLINKRKKEIMKKKPKFGCAKGKIYISPDFDAPIDDL